MEPTIYWVLTAIFLQVLFGCIGGWLGSSLYNRSLRRFAVELEYDLRSLEGRVNTEVKKRAQQASVEARKGEDNLVEWAKQNVGQAQPIQGGFNSWWHSKMAGKPGG